MLDYKSITFSFNFISKDPVLTLTEDGVFEWHLLLELVDLVKIQIIIYLLCKCHSNLTQYIYTQSICGWTCN